MVARSRAAVVTGPARRVDQLAAAGRISCGTVAEKSSASLHARFDCQAAKNRNNGRHPMNPRLLSFAFALVTTVLHAENWSNWRGPLHNGSSPEKNLPAAFSKTEGVKWSVAMPGASAATPVIWGDRVFATAADPQTKKQSALCLDRRTGAQLWRAEISEFTTDGQYSNSCSPSPVTDGKLAVTVVQEGLIRPPR